MYHSKGANKGVAMDKIIERGLLFDFYGELLTPHQQKIYSEAVFNDLSYGELSEGLGISRQGIHDLIKRCDKQLLEYEEKLCLIAKFKRIKAEVIKIDSLVEEINAQDALKTPIKESLQRIVEEL